MYILYYLNENLTLQTMEVQTLNNPILITEPTIFVAIRSDKGFEKEPHECLNLTHLERLFIYSDFNDTSFLMEGHFRKPNTFLTSSCEIDFIDVEQPFVGCLRFSDDYDFAVNSKTITEDYQLFNFDLDRFNQMYPDTIITKSFRVTQQGYYSDGNLPHLTSAGDYDSEFPITSHQLSHSNFNAGINTFYLQFICTDSNGNTKTIDSNRLLIDLAI